MAAIALAALVGMKTLERNKNINETLLMANVEALTSEEVGNNHCPSPDYVPNRFIEVVTTTATGTSNLDGSITVENGNTYSGEFTKGKTYIVVISTKNCSGREQGACCNQKDVGTTVIKK